MQTTAQKLYQFLSACRGNWRNTIFISYTEYNGSPGVLMAADRDARPVFMDVAELCSLTGEQIETGECRGYLRQAEFEDIYSLYLLWQCPSSEENFFRAFSRPESPNEKGKKVSN